MIRHVDPGSGFFLSRIPDPNPGVRTALNSESRIRNTAGGLNLTTSKSPSDQQRMAFYINFYARIQGHNIDWLYEEEISQETGEHFIVIQERICKGPGKN
jgi:hypothetical protein